MVCAHLLQETVILTFTEDSDVELLKHFNKITSVRKQDSR